MNLMNLTAYCKYTQYGMYTFYSDFHQVTDWGYILIIDKMTTKLTNITILPLWQIIILLCFVLVYSLQFYSVCSLFVFESMHLHILLGYNLILFGCNVCTDSHTQPVSQPDTRRQTDRQTYVCSHTNTGTHAHTYIIIMYKKIKKKQKPSNNHTPETNTI